MFNSIKQQNKKKEKRIRILGVFILIFNALICLFVALRPKKWKRLVKGQAREIKELSTGKEDFNRFCKDSWKLAKDFFIPYEGNDHKPKSLRPKSLGVYVAIAIVIKIAVTGFLFFTYPDQAQLAAIVAERMVSLVNTERTDSGVAELSVNQELVTAAARKGSDMLEKQYFAHDTPDGKKPWQWINRTEYDYVYAGENLAMDFTSAEVVQAAFMKSPSHRRNILNPKYKEMGVAVLSGEMNGRQTILLVEFFGTQRKDISTLATTQQPASEQPTVVSQVKPETSVVPAQPTKPTVAGEQISEPVNQEIESITPEVPTEGIIVVAASQQDSKALVDLVIEYSNIFFIAFLIFILVSLTLNIFIKIRVQHSSVILQTVVVAALMAAMILVKFHFVEEVAPHILIL